MPSSKLRLNRKPGRLSIAAVAIADILLNIIGANGRLDPSIATLAELARVDASTVVRCLGRLKACGLLDWTRQLMRCAAGDWRVEQTSNAYVLTVPAGDAQFAPPVNLRWFKKKSSEESGSGERPFESAARQLRALGHPVPLEWGL